MFGCVIYEGLETSLFLSSKIQLKTKQSHLDEELVGNL